ncbi:type II toxin-antitoxin system VapB family antitoxin [Mycobacterium sp.]|uniref:type II toxin-antitoxin system VapB family antitoxin n=1 Tax=Mycobacterium sp. TaxID=1785 RepID=UPI003D6A2826
MSDILIRDLPSEVLTGLDALAARLGLSRSEYIRRRLTQDAQTARQPVAETDLQAFADTFADLGDAEVMSRAWDESE